MDLACLTPRSPVLVCSLFCLGLDVLQVLRGDTTHSLAREPVADGLFLKIDDFFGDHISIGYVIVRP